MKPTLLFDYGGTLDTGACHWSYILHEGYARAGVQLAPADFRAAYVCAERALATHPHIQPQDDFLQLLRKKVALQAEQLRGQGHWPFRGEESERKAEAVAAYCDGFARRATAASGETLARLAERGYAMGVVSNFYGNLTAVLREYGLLRHFAFIVESAVVGVRKPSPEIFRLAAQRAGVPPQDTLVIGDSYTKDILPATEAGCGTVWYKGREWEERQYDESVPTHVITSLRQLEEILAD